MPRVVSEYTRVSNERHVRQHGADGISLNPPGARWDSRVLVYDVCPNRNDVSEDEEVDEVLEKDRDDNVEVDMFDLLEDKNKDSEDKSAKYVMVFVGRNQSENVEVVGRFNSGGSRWNGYVCSVVRRCGLVKPFRRGWL